jgi:hypothetical protein
MLVVDCDGIAVALVPWPDEEAALDALLRAGRPRVLLVKASAPPPDVRDVLEDEPELSLVCACATIAPPPIIAPARPTDSRPLRIHFCICITSSRSARVGVTKQHVH